MPREKAEQKKRFRAAKSELGEKVGKHAAESRLRWSQGQAVQVLKTIKDGGTLKMACAIAGVSLNVIREKLSENLQFRQEYDKAIAECAMKHVQRISEGEKQWQSSAWYLERRWFKTWGSKANADQGSTHKTVFVRKVDRNKGQVANADVKRRDDDEEPPLRIVSEVA